MSPQAPFGEGGIHLRKSEGSDAGGDGNSSRAGDAACREPAPQSPVGQAREDPNGFGGPVA